ncbi:MAG: IS66 family insertion sequence element accessory protein TnpB [Planctomycetota bacterium]|nr:IS66 family insertion sequence element accessory protein TnpB [Planctomycetota bacterium]MDA1177698.1 IS66 family insertion sequence element accessory protein TnpB [Planctomycetota bacterium]
MLSTPSNIQIFVYVAAMDMRKGFDGLSGIVRAEMRRDPMDGSMYLFINKRRDRMKILLFADGGYWLYYRLLEAGTFEEFRTSDDSGTLQIDSTQLAMLLSGVSLSASQRRRKRFSAKSDSPRNEAA